MASFTQELLKLPPTNLDDTIKTQNAIINRISDTNKTLRAFNKFALSRQEENLVECTNKLINLKNQLESVHKRIKAFKATIRKDHPNVYQQAVDSLPPLPEDLQD